MNKRLVAVIAVLLAGWWFYGDDEENSRTSAPDQKLASHYGAMCKVAKSNIDSPKKGVQEWFAYLGNHSPTMLKHFGETLVLIERISDDSAHDKRARQAAKTMQAPLIRCAPTLEKFFGAVEQDPAAHALLERGLERFGRTLEILFGQGMSELPAGIPLPTLR